MPASTVDVICHTDAYGSTENNAGTVTDPVRAMRARSLRSRSTISTFSARFFASFARNRAAAASSRGSSARGAVPFIGRARSNAPVFSTNSSGEHDTIHAPPGSATSAPAIISVTNFFIESPLGWWLMRYGVGELNSAWLSG